MTDSDVEPARIGTVVGGRYRVGDALGTGGMGAVYRALDLRAGGEVALKILRPHLGASDEAQARFEREAYVGGKLVHPNCVGVVQLGRCDDGAIYLAMELLEGESLGDVLAREGRLPWRRVLRIARHVLRGLGHAHEQAIVHRDIKPDNIFLTLRDGDPDFARVLDFGIAKLVGDAGPAITAAGLTVGTPDYLSPEQAQGTVLDGRSDLYSLSAVLFELLTGVTPFGDPELIKILTGHTSKPVPRFADVAPDADVPADVEALVRDGLAKHPADRISSAAVYVGRIDRLLEADDAIVLDGRYRLGAPIGRGAWGRVYRATHLGIDRTVAIKILEPRVLADDDARRRFEREARAAGKLIHPNCVAVTDFGATPDGSRYLAMELADGPTLDDVLGDETRLPVARAVHVMRHLLRGLSHAHGHGIVHRDLKPSNIVLTTSGADRDFAKILDFGMARMVSGNDRITRTGIVAGTPRYMAPEQALDKEIDPRTDLYAASVILFEMIAGRTPFDADDTSTMLKAHLQAPVPRIADVAPGVAVSAELEELVRRGLAKAPDDRPATADAYLTLLDRAAGDATIELSALDASVLPAPAAPRAKVPPPTPVAVAVPVPASVTVPRRSFTRRQLAFAGGAAALLIIGVIAAMAGGSSKPAPAAAPVEDEGLVMEPESAPSIDPAIAAALKLAGDGNAEEAAKQLRALRQRRPDDAQVPYALGRVYHRLGWPNQTIESYRAAIKLDAAMRDDPQLIRELIALLGSKSAWQDAAKLLEREVGASAHAALAATAKSHKDGTVRARAAKLRDQVAP